MLLRRHRKTHPIIVRYRSRFCPELKWKIAGYYVGGKRVRRFFKTKDDARIFIERLAITTENLGTRATQINQRLHVMAIECSDRLLPYGKTVTDATDFYCQHLKAIQRSSTLNQLAGRFLQAKQSDGCGDRYLKDLRNRLNRFQQSFGEAVVAAITTTQCDEWLRSLSCSGPTRNGYRRVLSAFFSYARAHEYCTDNPITRIRKAKEVDKPIGVLIPKQVRALLTKAVPELVPLLAIGAFAGLRAAEIVRLDWKEINLDRNFIEVTARKSKTASRRLVTIQPNLRAWLKPFRRKEGFLVPARLSEKVNAARKSAGIQSWPHNALRHSYASFHLAKFQDANALALQLGHTTTKLIFEHYREVVSPQEAEAYWSIRPPRKKCRRV